MESIAANISLPLQYGHIWLFAILALFSPSWRRCAILLFIASVTNYNITPALNGLISVGVIGKEAFWVYGAIDAITCTLLLCGAFVAKPIKRLFWGTKVQAGLLIAFVTLHLYTSVEYYFHAIGVLDARPIYDHYLTASVALNIIQMIVGGHGLREVYNSLRGLYLGVFYRGGLGGVFHSGYAKLRKRIHAGERLFQ